MVQPPRRVAVIGATGCVGRQICAAFAARGDDVLGIARRRRSRLDEHDFLAVDVAAADPGHLAALLQARGITAIVNAAGGWGTTEDEMRYAHVWLVDTLIATAAAFRDRIRVVHIGSIHEYGPVAHGTLIDESVNPAPVTPYARTKLAGSAALLQAGRDGIVDAVVLRCVNVCGPHCPEASFLGMLVRRLRRALRDGTPVDLSVAPAQRDFLDVRDVAHAATKAVDVQSDHSVFNIGRAQAVPMADLVDMVLDAAKLPADLIHRREAHVQSKGGDWTQADIRLATQVLDWRPRIELADSMRDMWLAQ
jgi:nucleoside-diphosphate-sugar epimerase